MNKKYIKFFLIGILFYVMYIIFLKKTIDNILLICCKKINQYSFFLKNNTQIFKLIYEYKKLQKEYNILKYLKKELLLSKNRLNNSNTYQRNFLFAEIIGYISHKKYKFFFINRGEIDGVRKNMIVVEGITILGKIVEVHSHYSKVLFLDNDEQYISVVFENSNCKGILKGNRSNEDNTMSLIHMYNEGKELINVGEKVYSSGKGLIFPPGYLIGTIKQIDKINYLENNIIIKNDYDINTIEYCDIIIDENITNTELEEIQITMPTNQSDQ
jgi:rod shape-determining protein MreC